MHLVALTGKTGVGKDYIASHLCNKYYIVAFGDLLKEELMHHGWSFEDLYVNRTGGSRQVLRMYSEQVLKRKDKHYFVKRMEQRLKIAEFHGYTHFLIPDLRFPEELEWILSQKGRVIRVVDPEGNQARKKQEGRVEEDEKEPLEYYDDVFRNTKNTILFQGELNRCHL